MTTDLLSHLHWLMDDCLSSAPSQTGRELPWDPPPGARRGFNSSTSSSFSVIEFYTLTALYTVWSDHEGYTHRDLGSVIRQTGRNHPAQKGLLIYRIDLDAPRQ